MVQKHENLRIQYSEGVGFCCTKLEFIYPCTYIQFLISWGATWYWIIPNSHPIVVVVFFMYGVVFLSIIMIESSQITFCSLMVSVNNLTVSKPDYFFPFAFFKIYNHIKVRLSIFSFNEFNVCISYDICVIYNDKYKVSYWWPWPLIPLY